MCVKFYFWAESIIAFLIQQTISLESGDFYISLYIHLVSWRIYEEDLLFFLSSLSPSFSLSLTFFTWFCGPDIHINFSAVGGFSFLFLFEGKPKGEEQKEQKKGRKRTLQTRFFSMLCVRACSFFWGMGRVIFANGIWGKFKESNESFFLTCAKGIRDAK